MDSDRTIHAFGRRSLAFHDIIFLMYGSSPTNSIKTTSLRGLSPLLGAGLFTCSLTVVVLLVVLLRADTFMFHVASYAHSIQKPHFTVYPVVPPTFSKGVPFKL